MPRRRQYTDETLAEAVEAISSGKRQVDVAKETRIPSSTLAKYVRKKRNNEGSSHARRGPEPAVTTEDEADLVSWTVGMQLNGTPACRADIIARGSQMVPLIGDAEARLSDVWYFRFAARHPELTMRQAQTVSRARNECSFEKLELFFETVKSLISVNDLNAMRIYNMNETSFISCNRSATVVALRGSKSVWRKDITANFHLSVVACGSASGRVVPPLFIFPGMRVERDLMSGCGIEGARVTCSASGFIKKVIFVKWVEMFAKSVPSAVKCPLLLIFDGYLSHLSIDLIDKGEELGIIYRRISSYKKTIRVMVRELQYSTGAYKVDKRAALKIEAEAWTQSVHGKNCTVRFRAADLYPLSLSQLKKRFELFQRCWAKSDAKLASWLRHRDSIRAIV